MYDVSQCYSTPVKTTARGRRLRDEWKKITRRCIAAQCFRCIQTRLILPRGDTTVTTPIYSLLYAFAGGAFWKVAPYITDQPTHPKERITLITTNLFDIGLEFGDGRGDEFQLVFSQVSQRMDLLDAIRL